MVHHVNLKDKSNKAQLSYRQQILLSTIEEEDENVFIPSAVEYDPDAKPPMYQNRRFRLYAGLAVFVVILVAVAVGVGISFASDDDVGPTKQQIRESLGIRETVERVVGSEVLNITSSPYSKALRWMTLSDPLELLPEDPQFIQRYVLAYFYYATTEKEPWYSCNPPQDEETKLCTYSEVTGVLPEIVRSQQKGSVRWLSEADECEWVGVECDNFNQVYRIDVGKYNTKGIS